MTDGAEDRDGRRSVKTRQDRLKGTLLMLIWNKLCKYISGPFCSRKAGRADLPEALKSSEARGRSLNQLLNHIFLTSRDSMTMADTTSASVPLGRYLASTGSFIWLLCHTTI